MQIKDQSFSPPKNMVLNQISQLNRLSDNYKELWPKVTESSKTCLQLQAVLLLMPNKYTEINDCNIMKGWPLSVARE